SHRRTDARAGSRLRSGGTPRAGRGRCRTPRRTPRSDGSRAGSVGTPWRRLSRTVARSSSAAQPAGVTTSENRGVHGGRFATFTNVDGESPLIEDFRCRPQLGGARCLNVGHAHPYSEGGDRRRRGGSTRGRRMMGGWRVCGVLLASLSVGTSALAARLTVTPSHATALNSTSSDVNCSAISKLAD